MVYQSLQCNVQESICLALLDEVKQTLPDSKQKLQTSFDLVAQSHVQPCADQTVGAGPASLAKHQLLQISNVQQPVRTVKAAWPESPKRNSVSPMPPQDMDVDSTSVLMPPLSTTASLPLVPAASWEATCLTLPVAMESCYR